MTGTRRSREHELRALARLVAQCRLNVGDATEHGRLAEARAWTRVGQMLISVAAYARQFGLPVQATLFDAADEL